MHWRYRSIVIGGVAPAAAFATVLMGYAFELEQNLIAAGLHFLATLFITAIALAAALWLDKPDKEEADRGHDIDRLPSASIDPAPQLDAPVDVERLSEIISGVSPFVQILSEQINNATKETELAVVDVVTKLQKADDILEKLVGYLKGSANEKIIPIIEQTQDCLRDSNELFDVFLSHRVQAMMESGSRLGKITDLVCSLDGIVHSIRNVAKRTHLLALNATIEAARVGDAGRGFAVVASEIKALSRQSDRAAKDIGEGLQTLKAAIVESVEALTVRHAHEEKLNLDFITERIGELGEDLKNLVQHEQEIIIRTQKDSENMAEIVISLLGSMQFQDVVSQRLKYAKDNLGNVVRHSIELAEYIKLSRDGNYNLYDVTQAKASAHIHRTFSFQRRRKQNSRVILIISFKP